MTVVAICIVIRAVFSFFKMLGKHSMKVVIAVFLQMGKLRDGEIKWVTRGHFLAQWQSQIPELCLSFILHLLWNLISCTLRPVFPTHAKLYLLEPQPSKFPVVPTGDTSGFISCSCVDVDCLSHYVYPTMRAESWECICVQLWNEPSRKNNSNPCLHPLSLNQNKPRAFQKAWICPGIPILSLCARKPVVIALRATQISLYQRAFGSRGLFGILMREYAAGLEW